MDVDLDKTKQFEDLDNLLERPSKFAKEDFEPDPDFKEMVFDNAKVLVIGAGGLGCEILKNLALSGIRDIHVIDLDTIDVTNLNRQFLFRKEDVGSYKAQAAANFIMKRCPGVKVTPYNEKIQTFDEEFYSQFQVIVAGLDNVEARQWLNMTLHNMVKFDPETKKPDMATVIPMIDGGTEGFKGQARVIMPFVSGCFECTISTLPPQETYPMCTIAETPRLPEHCIQHALVI
jgi:ubiquitin-activating enzyme E1 C